MDDGNLSRPSFSNPHRPSRRAPEGVQRAARAVAGALVALSSVVTANGSRGRHARPTGFTRFTDRMATVARHESRWVFGGVLVGGSVLSILLGMTIGGAFSGVDVALAPKSPAPAGPRIEYAAPAQASHSSSHTSSHSPSHPATKAAGSNQDNGGNAPASATTAPSTAPTSTSGSAPPSTSTAPSSPTSVPTTTPTTPPSTPSTPTTTVPSKPKPKPNPIQQLIGG